MLGWIALIEFFVLMLIMQNSIANHREKARAQHIFNKCRCGQWSNQSTNRESGAAHCYYCGLLK